MSQSNHQKSIYKMQRYVLGSVGLMSAAALSFPIAMARVSATKQFPGQSVKSQDCANQALKESKVIEWAKDCAPLKVEPKKVDAKPVVVTSAPSPIASPSPKPPIAVLKLGMSGNSVTTLQTKLQSAGVFSGVVDGIFGEDTETSVIIMQTQLKQEPTGVANDQFIESTWDHFNSGVWSR